MVTELEPGMLVGRYRLVEQIARGGMGTVWVARDERLDRTVAVKVLPALLVSDEAAQRRFEREARAMGRLQHPNVVSIFDVGSADPGTGEELPFLVMALVRGESLDNLIARGPLPPPRVVRIFTQVASALATAHEAGVVHRDLKPSNIMVGDGDHVNVLDFGLARLAQQEGRPHEETLTTPGMVLGSCPYMAPEQALGQKVGPASDIFSCGAVMYEALSGRRAFSGSAPMRVLQAVVRCEYAPLPEVAPDIPAELVAVVERCLAKDLTRRYGSATELAHDLTAVVERREARPAAVDPAPGAPRSPAPVSRPAWYWIASAAVLLVLGGLAAGFALGRAGGRQSEIARPSDSPPPAAARATGRRAWLRTVGGATAVHVLPVGEDRMVAAVGCAAGSGTGTAELPASLWTGLETLAQEGSRGAVLLERLGARLGEAGREGPLSLAVVEAGRTSEQVTIATVGAPVVLLVGPDGRVEELDPQMSPSETVGWFPREREVPFGPGSHMVLVTDCPRSEEWPRAGRGSAFREALGDRVDPGQLDRLLERTLALEPGRATLAPFVVVLEPLP